VAAGDTAGAAVSADPHSPQNLTSGGFGVWHDAQTTDSDDPHSPQNFLPTSFALPQVAQ
jgi:hypothetical protein